MALGGATTDGSVGAVQTLSGHFTIAQSLGTVAGGNLFHSFAQFNIGPTERATFTTTSSAIQNVISRVTGGAQSSIHGLLKLDAAAGSHPEFYFVNPAGVVFGAGAQIDVPAGFHVSTAQQLRFSDGSVWETNAPTLSGFTIAPPESFGFLGGRSAAPLIFNNLNADATPGAGPNIALKPGHGFSAAAGTVQFDSAKLSVSEGGQIKIVAERDISIRNGALISSTTASEKAAGAIELRGASITIDRGSSSNPTGIRSRTDGSGNAGLIGVNATGQLSILRGGILSETFSTGSVGRVDIEAGAMTIRGFGALSGIFDDAMAVSSERVNSGGVRVRVAGELSLVNGGQISSSSFSLNKKPAGQVDVAAGTLFIDREDQKATGIFAVATDDTEKGSNGDAGSIKINVAGQMSILRKGEVSTGALSGRGGVIEVRANSLTIEGQRTWIAAGGGGASSGDAGSVRVDVDDQLSLIGGGVISSSARGQNGAGGSIDIHAGEVFMDGVGSEVRAKAETGSLGRAGDINISARERFVLRNGARVSIQNDAVRPEGALIQTAAFEPSVGGAGKLSITAPQISVEGGEITAASKGNVAASDIEVNAAQGLTLRNAAITTSAQDGNGGAIDINGGRFTLIERSQVSTSVLGAQNGNGGDIRLKADTLVMQTGFIQANTAARQATGGNVNIDVGLLVSGGALVLGGQAPLGFDPSLVGVNAIQAAAPGGVSGNVQVSSPIVDIAGNLRGLSAEVIDYGLLGKDLCRVGFGSSFTPVGRGGLRVSAREWIRDEARVAPVDWRASEPRHAPASPALRVNGGGECR